MVRARGSKNLDAAPGVNLLSGKVQPGGGSLTGKTRGIPPLTGFEPSRWALELRKRFSLPLADFQEMTVAPYNKTCSCWPVGRLAVTRELSSEMETCGVGWMGETGMAAGFLARSMLAV